MFFLVCYLLIGVVAGLLAKRLMPGRAGGGAALAALGAAGALAFGVAALILLGYGRSVARDVWWLDASGDDLGGTLLPAYWLTLPASAAGALLALALRKLFGAKDGLP
jgi:uncharacterized membrane protein YeaQ/YmgE (transglycosylase-associated protein family)